MLDRAVEAVDDTMATVQKVAVTVPILAMAVVTGDVRVVLNSVAAVPLAVAEILSGSPD